MPFCWDRPTQKLNEDVPVAIHQAALIRRKCSSGWTKTTTVNCRKTSGTDFRPLSKNESRVQTQTKMVH